MGDEQLK